MENIDYAHIFEEIANLLEIEGANPFRVRAYKNAARTLETLTQSVESLLHSGEMSLTEIPGIGKDLAAKIVEIHRTGELQFLKDLRARVPSVLAGNPENPWLGGQAGSPALAIARDHDDGSAEGIGWEWKAG